MKYFMLIAGMLFSIGANAQTPLSGLELLGQHRVTQICENQCNETFDSDIDICITQYPDFFSVEFLNCVKKAIGDNRQCKDNCPPFTIELPGSSVGG